ncbi:hypothetical protein [Brachybacterium huguangmaarense]
MTALPGLLAAIPVVLACASFTAATLRRPLGAVAALVLGATGPVPFILTGVARDAGRGAALYGDDLGAVAGLTRLAVALAGPLLRSLGLVGTMVAADRGLRSLILRR